MIDWQKRDSEIKCRITGAPIDEVIVEVCKIWCYYRSMCSLYAAAIPMPFDMAQAYTHGQERIIAELGKEQFEQLMEKAWSDYQNQIEGGGAEGLMME